MRLWLWITIFKWIKCLVSVKNCNPFISSIVNSFYFFLNKLIDYSESNQNNTASVMSITWEQLVLRVHQKSTGMH